MQFDLPKTAEEMINTLQEIFRFYRLEREVYVPAEMDPITLEELEFTPLTESQLQTKAETLLKAKQDKLIISETEEIEERISSLNVQVAEINANASAQLELVNLTFSETENKLKQQATENGLYYSSVMLDRLSKLESEKNEKILAITSERDQKITAINGEISALNTKKSNLKSVYNQMFSKEVVAKKLQLKDEQDELVRSVFKYNNSVSEKYQRSKINIEEINATLRARFMEINSEMLTKDMLVEMGYYEDVIKCVTHYYDTYFTPAEAYTDIKTNTKIIPYLDDYYEHVVYKYRINATD